MAVLPSSAIKPELQSVTSLSASVASLCSRIAIIRSPSVRNRPYPAGFSALNPSATTAAPELSGFRNDCSVSARRSGVSANSTRRSSNRSPISCFAANTACAVPRRCSWTTIFALGHNFKISALTSSRPGPITAISVSTPASCTIMITCPIIERFAISCKTFGISDFIRVPSPAARMIAAQDRANDDEPEPLETIENQLVVTGMIRPFRL